MLGDSRLRFCCDSRVLRLDGGERRFRIVDHRVTNRPFVLQDLDASLLLASSLLEVCLRDHRLRGPHLCTMVWLHLMNWFLVWTFLKSRSRARQNSQAIYVPDVLKCSLVEVLKMRPNLLL